MAQLVFDVAVIGAGAAGMMCAGVAGQRGKRVVLIDHSDIPGEKIRISGGGRCNFTNVDTSYTHFLSDNPRFCRSALARYTPADFIALVRKYRIAFHEKHKGQLFCDESSQQIIDMLKSECDLGQVAWRLGCSVHGVERSSAGFELQTTMGRIQAAKLVVATGGLSIPKIGASDLGYRIARQFSLSVVPTRPALVPLTFDPQQWAPFQALSGLSLEVQVSAGQGRFLEDLLLTHRGLSGPAILQISSFWQPGQPLGIDLLPALTGDEWLLQAKTTSRKQVDNFLAEHLPERLAHTWVERYLPDLAQRSMADVPDKALRLLAQQLHRWEIKPGGTEGYRKAEVTAGGVDTRQISSSTFEAQTAPGLHFIGEVLDVTGWLGGFNFQWAWASAAACAKAL